MTEFFSFCNQNLIGGGNVFDPILKNNGTDGLQTNRNKGYISIVLCLNYKISMFEIFVYTEISIVADITLSHNIQYLTPEKLITNFFLRFDQHTRYGRMIMMVVFWQ